MRCRTGRPQTPVGGGLPGPGGHTAGRGAAVAGPGPGRPAAHRLLHACQQRLRLVRRPGTSMTTGGGSTPACWRRCDPVPDRARGRRAELGLKSQVGYADSQRPGEHRPCLAAHRCEQQVTSLQAQAFFQTPSLGSSLALPGCPPVLQVLRPGVRGPGLYPRTTTTACTPWAWTSRRSWRRRIGSSWSTAATCCLTAWTAPSIGKQTRLSGGAFLEIPVYLAALAHAHPDGALRPVLRFPGQPDLQAGRGGCAVGERFAQGQRRPFLPGADHERFVLAEPMGGMRAIPTCVPKPGTPASWALRLIGSTAGGQPVRLRALRAGWDPVGP